MSDDLTISTGTETELDEARGTGDMSVPGDENAGFVEEGGFDAFSGSTSERKIGGGTLLIIAVILVAVAGVVSMRKLAQVTAAAVVDADIEAMIEDFIETLAPPGSGNPGGGPTTIDEGEEILARISEAYTERQIPLQDVQRNPFILFTVPAMPTGPVVDPSNMAAEQERRWREARVKRTEELEQAGAGFHLKSIMGGSSPMAIIDERIVRVGDIIESVATEGEFRVAAIARDSVDLEVEVPEYDLTVAVTVYLQRER